MQVKDLPLHPQASQQPEANDFTLLFYSLINPVPHTEPKPSLSQSEASIELQKEEGDFGGRRPAGRVERVMGRWKVDQHYHYIMAVHQCSCIQQIIEYLGEKVPRRHPSQIKAHHAKMMKKHHSLCNIRKSYPDPKKNDQILGVCAKLEAALRAIIRLSNRIEACPYDRPVSSVKIEENPHL